MPRHAGAGDSGARRNGHGSVRETGAVRWFSDHKGYGFIAPDGGGDDVFVRYSSLQGDGFRALAEGQRVSFCLAADDHGPQAVDVEVLAGSRTDQRETNSRTVPSSVVR